MKQVLIAFSIVSFLLSLQFLLPQKVFKEYSDEELRAEALSRAMKPVPKTFKELLKLQNSKENSLTKEKILLGKNFILILYYLKVILLVVIVVIR